MGVARAIETLGLTRDVSSEVDFIDLIEDGLPSEARETLRQLGSLSVAELAEIAPVRARATGRLSPEDSDRIVRALEVFASAQETFRGRDAGNSWMRRSNEDLQGRTPLSLLGTWTGAHIVEGLLVRARAQQAISGTRARAQAEGVAPLSETEIAGEIAVARLERG